MGDKTKQKSDQIIKEARQNANQKHRWGWTNNALIAGLIVALFAAFLAYVLQLLQPKPEIPGTPERRREDAELLLKDITEVRQTLEKLRTVSSLRRGSPSDSALHSDIFKYVDLRNQQDRISNRERIQSLEGSTHYYLEAYDSAMSAADDAFDCVHKLRGAILNQTSERRLDVPIPPHGLAGICPEKIDATRSVSADLDLSNVIAAIRTCEAEMTIASERIANNDFDLSRIESCFDIPAPPNYTYRLGL